jgi:hypothetical protein
MNKIIFLILVISACASTPGIKVATSPKDVAQCEGVPTFVPLSCKENRSCEECLKDMSAEVSHLGGNTLLLSSPSKECSPKDLTATVYRCP